MSKELIVGDYMFSTLEEANVAKLEMDKIEKLTEKLGDADDEMLYKVYNRSIEKNTFRTPVGLEFMKVLKKRLEKSRKVKDDILPIPVSVNNLEIKEANDKQDDIKKVRDDARKFSTFFKWSLFVNAILVIVIIALFVITSTADNPNIINYENALIDKYSSWETELNEKDKELRAKERELDEREKEINNSQIIIPDTDY
ncbi:MAG: hypothetical protein K5988_08330 [Lachnospiraceae bacterium]|nr:hypothetical protein [Lachnospiraceae bacterium]